MQVILYKNTGNTKSFKRNFTKQATYECVLKEGSDALNPEIILETSNPVDFNMMFIAEFKRYYFIGCENINNNMWRIYSKGVDTLFTYRNELLRLNAIIDKQEYIHNDLIDDGSYVHQVDTFIETVQFIGGSGFDDNPSYILITA